MTSKELYRLRAALPKGSKKIIAAKFGVSEGHVTQVLCGHRNNDAIIIEAVNIVSEHMQQLKNAETFIQSLE